MKTTIELTKKQTKYNHLSYKQYVKMSRWVTAGVTRLQYPSVQIASENGKEHKRYEGDVQQ